MNLVLVLILIPELFTTVINNTSICLEKCGSPYITTSCSDLCISKCRDNNINIYDCDNSNRNKRSTGFRLKFISNSLTGGHRFSSWNNPLNQLFMNENRSITYYIPEEKRLIMKSEFIDNCREQCFACTSESVF